MQLAAVINFNWLLRLTSAVLGISLDVSWCPKIVIIAVQGNPCHVVCNKAAGVGTPGSKQLKIVKFYKLWPFGSAMVLSVSFCNKRIPHNFIKDFSNTLLHLCGHPHIS